VDIIVDDPRSTAKHATVNADNLVKISGLSGSRKAEASRPPELFHRSGPRRSWPA
jgi:hypothetical protein